MRYGISVPNLDEFADPRRVAELARRAEEAGWDGFFVWDHVVFPYGAHEVADPWVVLTAVALATERIRFGPLVTAVARRRPGTLARQTTSLDRLSGGRLVFGAGLGFTLAAEFGTWGEPVAPKVVARRLDEGLEVLAGLWSGQRVDFRGEQVTALDVTFQPTPAQRPRPPVWIGCNWPARRPLRRAARWDGVVPMVVSPDDGSWNPTPAVVTEIVAAVREQRANSDPSTQPSSDPGSDPSSDSTSEPRTDPSSDPTTEPSIDPFDVVITGRTRPDQPAEARETVESIGAAGATWWLEGFRPAPDEYAAALRRIEAGPLP
ncbi:LLM class flavin-dependent oxidoreductase [Frankia sp. AgB1.9]|uniref:LLM class flavin-dependent oxidoreductase n=1 Tax=unclassified Frankia TaxID=2632575 RepID=UPI0019347FDE|nr:MULTISPECIES: LLM class flavin-dependent oxidoreductase [unclassified Frankia]MBL7493605.1 LLM class flavin-dependent oxidoreductase [Frankia sp. AgW1.1]MBL7551380.1 LLM class flavin-dependent oxidoreductase [Frankia sp. AgB1.9]MBL7618955.1 LLM class flavin-dependent oxidoreductase [Frankia sp. AgB1.8]